MGLGKSSDLGAEPIGIHAGHLSRGMTPSYEDYGGSLQEKFGVWQVSWQVTEPQSPSRDGQEEEEVTDCLRLGMGSLCSWYTAHALPSIKGKRDLVPFGHACKPPPHSPK